MIEIIPAYQNEEAARIQREMPEPPAGPAQLFMSADGAMVPLVGGEWAEVKTLVIGEVQPPQKVKGEQVIRTAKHSYFSRLTHAETFQRLALVETQRRGVRRRPRLLSSPMGQNGCRSLPITTGETGESVGQEHDFAEDYGELHERVLFPGDLSRLGPGRSARRRPDGWEQDHTRTLGQVFHGGEPPWGNQLDEREAALREFLDPYLEELSDEDAETIRAVLAERVTFEALGEERGKSRQAQFERLLRASRELAAVVAGGYIFLTQAASVARGHDGWAARHLKTSYARWLPSILDRPVAVLAGSAVLLAAALDALAWSGSAFLPEFHEGTLTLSIFIGVSRVDEEFTPKTFVSIGGGLEQSTTDYA